MAAIESCRSRIEVDCGSEDCEVGSRPELHPGRVASGKQSIPAAYHSWQVAGANRELEVTRATEARAERVLGIVVDDREQSSKRGRTGDKVTTNPIDDQLRVVAIQPGR